MFVNYTVNGLIKKKDWIVADISIFCDTKLLNLKTCFDRTLNFSLNYKV